MITHVFKGNSDIFGTFAYIENDELVIGENVLEHSGYIFRGSLEAFRNSRDYLKLAARNRPLLDDINYYYNYVYKPKKNQEDTTMNNTEALIERLTKHSDDYYKQKTQDFEQVAKDCLAAADKLYMYSNSEISDKLAAGTGVEGRSTRTTKLCEIKVDRKDSLQELTYHLTANGYQVQTAVVWKQWPQSGIDYWMIAIYDKEEKK
jgi:hypothetical protein